MSTFLPATHILLATNLPELLLTCTVALLFLVLVHGTTAPPAGTKFTDAPLPASDS